MRSSVPAFAISFPFVAWLLCVAPALAQQAETDRFELRGIVVNAATGEPVSGAVVQMYASEGKTQFAGTDGTFVFTNLPRGRYSVTARKPGFFNKQELGRWNAGLNAWQDVPSNGEMVLKLTPEGIISGQVKNENGEPIEGVTVRAQLWQMQDGRRLLRNAADAVTDDEGHFRIAELRRGAYYLSFLPTNLGGWYTYNQLSGKKQEDQGYGSQFYPGVADVESATAIELRAGAQVYITQALGRQRLFEVAGVVHGANPESGFSLMMTNGAGDAVQRVVRIDPKSGGFQIPGIPAGTYMLTATAQGPSEPGTEETMPPLRAALPIHLKSDLTGVVLTLGRGISAGVQVRDEIPPDGTDNVHQVVVRLISRGSPQYAVGTIAPPLKSERRAARIDDIVPGAYTAEATPNQAGYIASLRCGRVDLLRDDLTVAPGTALPPIEVTLRNDGAELSVAAMENGQPAAAGVVIYSEEYPRRSVMQWNDRGAFSLGNLAPGRYLVVAVKDAQDLEFRNPATMEKYLEHASAVTLQPGDKASVRVELQELQEERP